MSILNKIWLIVMFCIICGGVYELLIPSWKVAHIKPGEVYAYTPEHDNPFIPCTTRYYRVIDVKEGYILAIDSTYGDTISQRGRLFIFEAEKIK